MLCVRKVDVSFIVYMYVYILHSFIAIFHSVSHVKSSLPLTKRKLLHYTNEKVDGARAGQVTCCHASYLSSQQR